MIRWLSSFGNCASYDTVVGLETSLAQHKLATSSEVPSVSSRDKATVLDFGEETASGHGTTHHTNGIMVRLQAEVAESAKVQKVEIKKGCAVTKRNFCSIECVPSN